MKRIFLIFPGIIALITGSQGQTVADYDGNVYQTVTIGMQVWMKENLKTTHFSNGTPIPNITTPWFDLTSSAYCSYNNDDANVATYGRLYNWFAVDDSNRICPAGWHVPSDGDWIVLSNHLGNDTTAGGKLKEAGTAHWSGPNTGASNSSGFTALPGGNRSYDDNGSFGGLRDRGHWWSSSELSSNYAWHRSLYYDSEGFFIVLNGYIKRSGFSVRCVRDSLESAINEPDNAPNVRIGPNPAADCFIVECPSQHNLILSIYSLPGKLVLERNLMAGSNRIDISSFYHGIYAIEVRGGDWSVMRKLIKE